MTAVDRKQIRAAMAEHIGCDATDIMDDDADIRFSDDPALVYVGESADGEPSWIVKEGSSGFIVQYELGWYEQTGDADMAADVVPLMRAMEAASSALLVSLQGPKVTP